ncbi:MAG: pyrroline-5-carboxylate reductase [Paracoccaceae bacterium]
MDFSELSKRGLVILGCGKMGSAMLERWLRQGLSPDAVWVLDPNPSDWLRGTGVNVNAGVPKAPAVALIAVKPQMMAEALPVLQPLAQAGTLFITVAAGTRIAAYEGTLGAGTRLVRAMPNTPAAIGRGITALCGNAASGPADLDLAEALLSAVGQVVRLEGEHQMDAVTGVSGSGPAYVFHLIETLAAAAEAEGLPAPMALQLARATVAGAGALAEESPDDPAQLRRNVTSPGGTTAAALEVLMEPQTGFSGLMKRAVAAAVRRGKELGG